MTKSKVISITIKATICFFLIYFIVTKFDMKMVIQTIKRVDTTLFLEVFIFYFLANLFVFIRWFLTIKYMDISVGFYHIMKCYLMGIFFNFFLPTSVGGDFFKAYYVDTNSEKSTFKKRLFSVFFDRYVGLIVMVGVGGLFSLFLNVDISGIQLSYILFFIFGLMLLSNVLIMFYADKIDEVLERIPFLKRFSDTFNKIANLLIFV